MRPLRSEPVVLAGERIHNLPPDWDVAPLGAGFDVQQGKALSPQARGGLSPRPFLRTGNILWGRLDLRSLDTMDFSDEEANRLALRPGDLLVCEGGDIGRTALWAGQIPGCLYQNHVHRLRARRPDIDPEFVMYWMQAAFLHLRLYGGVGNRTTIPNLSAARLKQLPIAVPPFAEQKAMAAVLAKIQEAAKVRENIVTRLKEVKAATMAKLFREGLCGKTLKPTDIGEIPDDWTVVDLGDHCQIRSGGTPPRDVPSYWNGHIPWVKTGEIDYRPITRTGERITQAGLENSAAKLFPKGTLLMAMYGQGITRGKVAFLEAEAATNQAAAALLPSEHLDAGFLYAYCCFAYETIRNLAHGANQKNLSIDLIRRIRVPLPPDLHEQQGIHSVVAALDARCQAAARRETLYSHLFTSILQRLMSGQLRLTQFETPDVS